MSIAEAADCYGFSGLFLFAHMDIDHFDIV